MKQRWGLIALVAVISFLSGGWLLQRGVRLLDRDDAMDGLPADA